ncbi:MAG: MBL fold metallo-hydrolase [Candidatus Eremiobacteraeota bacterium]|nr:MBL fold metallo-hydrolase [Candidatus Eremiobacteraeota bacterium]
MVSDRIVRITADNPSPMTLEGTNSYLVFGRGGALVIDPGPADERHLAALVACAQSRGVPLRGIAVTHGHPDHAPGAAPLHARTGAPVYAHANARFPHDVSLADGDALPSTDVGLVALDAPGHADDHLVFWSADDGVLFTGDVVVGRGTVVIAPPRGDMRAYLATLRRLHDDFGGARAIFGGHGEPVGQPREKLEEYIAHRLERERQLLAALALREQTIPQLVASVYCDVSRTLWPAAARQVLAYLLALEREHKVRARTLERRLTSEERAILDPDLSALVDPQSAAVARAELGYDHRVERIELYGRM